MHDHFIICGFGSTGRSAAVELVARGVSPSLIVAVDRSRAALDDATRRGFVGVEGDASKRAVLQQAGIQEARAVVITPNRDDTAVLVTLTARELNPNAHIVTGGREQENLHLLRQGGADEVIDSTAAVGRMLGLAVHAPAAVTVLNDVLDAGTGLELVEVEPVEVEGQVLAPADTTLVSLIRDGRRLRPAELGRSPLRMSDRLIVLREANED